MKKYIGRTLLGVAMLAVWVGITVLPASADNVLYTQPIPPPPFGSGFSSQNDPTLGGPPNLFTMYDNFTLGSTSTITSVDWTGVYYNPEVQGPIIAWTLRFWSDNAGQPDTSSPPFYTLNVAGTGNETFLANLSGLPTYTYSLDTSFSASANTQYWLSVVPDLVVPPQWGWSGGTGGDGVSYQDFFGTRTKYTPTGGNPFVDMAFTLNGSSAVPEPSSLLLLGSGLAGLGGLAWRRRKS